MNIVITGARGFIGRNLSTRLNDIPGYACRLCDVSNDHGELRRFLADADVVYHLAGVSRPLLPIEFRTGNAEFTALICSTLRELGRTPRIVMSSSIQAEVNNPYGVSKRQAEKELEDFAAETGAEVRIYRLKNVFGKWCRPNYNSVVATFCHNIANGLPIVISDQHLEIELVYIDDVVNAFVSELHGGGDGRDLEHNIPSYKITLGNLAGRLRSFLEMRETQLTPDFSSPFTRALYATYLSYVPDKERCWDLKSHSDNRGTLAEFIRSQTCGQIFVSRTFPGVIRGNHYHHTKTERFLVVEGNGVIRMRHIESSEIAEYVVHGDAFQVVDIPPGFTHCIENIGPGVMVTLFWASERFDPDRPDTYYLPVVGQPPTPTT